MQEKRINIAERKEKTLQKSIAMTKPVRRENYYKFEKKMKREREGNQSNGGARAEGRGGGARRSALEGQTTST